MSGIHTTRSVSIRNRGKVMVQGDQDYVRVHEDQESESLDGAQDEDEELPKAMEG
jgi:hypothetical protein